MYNRIFWKQNRKLNMETIFKRNIFVWFHILFSLIPVSCNTFALLPETPQRRNAEFETHKDSRFPFLNCKRRKNIFKNETFYFANQISKFMSKRISSVFSSLFFDFIYLMYALKWNEGKGKKNKQASSFPVCNTIFINTSCFFFLLNMK